MKIAVLLSGGVDSSTALMRLKQAGFHDLTAFYLKIWLEDDLSYLGMCPWEEDLAYARAVCEAAGVPLEIVPLQTQYHDRVVAYALDELRRGHTPSPDIFCNERVKFGAFFEHVQGRYDKVATGHYARLDWLPGGADMGLSPLDPAAGQGPGRWRLLRAPDPVKDQTYFLSHLNQSQLSRILFPIGDLRKVTVRQYAHDWELANRDRPDSQGICFLGKIKYPDFVKFYLGEQPGPIVNASTGEVLGQHAGSWFHTVGQRSGLGLGNGPWYVSAKDTANNVVYVTHGNQLAECRRTSLRLADFNWIAGRIPDACALEALNASGLTAKLRHGPQLIPCTVALSPDHPGQLQVSLAEGDAGMAAGQFAVLYQGEDCLGSGTIQEPDPGETTILWHRHQAWLESLRQAAETAARTKAAQKKARRQQRRTGGEA